MNMLAVSQRLLRCQLQLKQVSSSRMQIVRLFSSQNNNSDSKAPVPASTSSTSKGIDVTAQNIGGPTITPTKSQKRYILLALKHKTTDEVPDVISTTNWNYLLTRARITVNLMLGVLVLILCSVAIASGRKGRADGETVKGNNEAWHRKVDEEHRLRQKSDK